MASLKENDFEKEKNLVQIAYKKYKQNVYYEQLDLFQRKKLADYECDPNFETKIARLSQIVKLIRENTLYENEIESFLKDIDFHLIPKEIKMAGEEKNEHNKENEQDKSRYLTNKKSSDEYYLDSVNFFIDAPIELHLLCVIWVMKVGVLIDNDLSDSCYWFRLNDKVKRPDDKSIHLFKLYHEQYALWRNSALENAKHILNDDKRDVAIISLDIRHCFYCINANFSEIVALIEKKVTSPDRQFLINLTSILEKIHQRYQDKISPYLKYSHDYLTAQENLCVIPIGLVSSGLLCNWHLKQFDKKIQTELNPSYYGRYVDDILIVISNPKMEESNQVNEFMNRYFLKTKILKISDSEPDTYYVEGINNLQIQSKKLLLHYYSFEHSHAMLDIFKQKIDDNASAFFLLPDDDLKYYINETAYNLLINGSTNKLRNITGIAENVTELSKNLTNIITGLGQSVPLESDLKVISDQIFKFYKGKNFINYSRTWEKLFAFALITRQYEGASKFYIDVYETIDKITKFSPNKDPKNNHESGCKTVLLKQLDDLRDYLRISFAISFALLGTDSKKIESDSKKFKRVFFVEHMKKYKKYDEIRTENRNVIRIAKNIRESNLLRHNYVAYPLINYTTYEGSLINWEKITEKFSNLSEQTSLVTLNDTKVKYSPRFIHFDEFYLFHFLIGLNTNSPESLDKIDDKYMAFSHIHKELCPIAIEPDNIDKILINHVYVPKIYSMKENVGTEKYDLKKEKVKTSDKYQIKIGVANVRINDEDLEGSYNPMKKPNITFSRQKELFKILNCAKIEDCDLLVLPELSVPPKWLPFMVKYARNHQMGLIFGLEYWILKQTKPIAYNFLVAALPILNKEQYKTCCVAIRCKNHYSPREIAELKRCGLSIPNNNSFKYDLFRWRNSQFSIYNCYELVDIEHRSLFKSELDFLVACVLNKDINYFSSIVESVTKDLHCYVVQVNCSEFGDSRITQPTNTERMDILRVSGGENSTILVGSLPIGELRHFQYLEYAEQDKRFKPTPPGFNKKRVPERGKCPQDQENI
ncbi:MAG: RNA-directed DNA polymerase [Methanoregula sp.]|nr:RNA-directed DNA polymerase [Methanoregula sp.]